MILRVNIQFGTQKSLENLKNEIILSLKLPDLICFVKNSPSNHNFYLKRSLNKIFDNLSCKPNIVQYMPIWHLKITDRHLTKRQISRKSSWNLPSTTMPKSFARISGKNDFVAFDPPDSRIHGSLRADYPGRFAYINYQ